MKRNVLRRIILGYVIFAVISFLIIPSFSSRYTQNQLQSHVAESAEEAASILEENPDQVVIISNDPSYVTDLKFDLLDGSYLTMVMIFLFSLLILVIFCLTVYLPLRKITKAAKAYSVGNYTQQTNLHSGNELGMISDTMDYMAQELNSLESDQRKFISNVSHDFRSPLTSIKGYAEAMADGTIPPELQEKYLKVIVFEAERLEKLTQSILELNKYDARGNLLELSVFSITALTERALLTFEGRIAEKEITFERNYDLEKNIYVRADEAKIDQVIHNLVDNAIKFSNQNSRICISISAKNEKVFVSVKDFGIGIPKESQNKIWERFYKTDASRGKDKKGSGLGLSIVKEIIHVHHENINVVSTAGVGTEFIFTLPLSKQGAATTKS